MSVHSDDDEVMFRGIVLSNVVRRFLARNRTQQVIDMGWMLDEDVVKDLVDASEKMMEARLNRLGVGEVSVDD